MTEPFNSLRKVALQFRYRDRPIVRLAPLVKRLPAYQSIFLYAQ